MRVILVPPSGQAHDRTALAATYLLDGQGMPVLTGR
jgi:hypothetical protein